MSVIDAVRRPEYTGDKRCWPCTVVNLAILAVGVAAVAVVGFPLLAAAVAVVGVAVVAVRGYLVPYTPQFAPRLVAALPIPEGLFHDAPDAGEAEGSIAEGWDESVPSPEELLGVLVQSGVLEAEGEDLFLSAAARDRWTTETERLRDSEPSAVADRLVETSPVATTVDVIDDRGRTFFVLKDGSGEIAGEQWLSRPVAIAEAAAVAALEPFVDDRMLRVAAAEPLRMFLEECPGCGGPVEETTEGSCCGSGLDPSSKPRDVLACGDCGRRLYTFPRLDEDGDEQSATSSA